MISETERAPSEISYLEPNLEDEDFNREKFISSTDSGWDNPFRPDGDLSREADEIVELIKGGKPITPTPGQTAPPLPGCDTTDNAQTTIDHDSSSSPLLKSSANSTNRHANSSPKPGQENGNAHGTPMKAATANSQQPVNDKVTNLFTFLHFTRFD